MKYQCALATTLSTLKIKVACLPSQHWYLSTKLHGIMSHKTVIFTVTTTETSPIMHYMYPGKIKHVHYYL